MWSCVIIVLFFSYLVTSQSIVEYLPGYPDKLPFTLETGYIGVGEQEEVQLFYYFIESERNPATDPLLLWLTGGPGCSALWSLTYEIGPLYFDYTASATRGNKPTLTLNPYSWTKVASIIFVDETAGTGFSYGTNEQAYNVSDTLAAEELCTFLRKWLISHPHFMNNPLYIAGDSYSGIIIPQIVQKILNGNEIGTTPPLILKGYILGNPFADENIDFNSRVEFAYRVNLLSDELYVAAKEDCHGWYLYVDPSNEACISDLRAINDCLDKLFQPNVLEPNCATVSPKPKDLNWDRRQLTMDLTDYIRPIPRAREPGPWCRQDDYVYIYIWANDKSVQDALHVRPGTIKTWSRCNKTLQDDYDYNVVSTLEIHRNLTASGRRVLIYSGDQDLIVPYVGTETWINSLNLTVDDVWTPWFVDGQVAGYTQKFRNNTYTLTYATVKGAGHTAPEYKPKESLAMLTRWLAYYHL
ncbi:Peptidase S10, serine carboxypeptidase [Dillenia turbinata]|uniref:Peptidase S10, serine carboxypeptidase n=1 Tax=Dillenia turbinata TaxID=194707 RepID=A0AAN8WA56_9MAGN